MSESNKTRERLREQLLSGTSLPPQSPRRMNYLSLLVIFALSVLAALLLVRLWGQLTYPYPLDTGEGTILASAWYAASGEPIYREMSEPPYIFTLYNPVMIWLTTLCFKLFGAKPFEPRAVSALFYAGTAVTIYAFVRRDTAQRSAALVAALFFAVERHLVSRAGYAVTDYPGIFFSAFGLYLWRAGGRKRYWALGAFVLAFFSKQTSVIAAAAAFTALFLEGKRGLSAKLFVFYLVACLAGTGALALLYGKAYLINAWVYTKYAPFDAAIAARRIATAVGLYIVPVVGLLFLAKRALKDRSLILPVVYTLFGLGFAITIGRDGASRSYFFDFAAGLSLIVGLLWTSVEAWHLGRGLTVPVAALTVLELFLVCAGALYRIGITGDMQPYDLRRDAAQREAYEGTSGIVYCRETGFDFGTEARSLSNDICKVNQLIAAGYFPAEEFVRPDERRAYSVVIIKKPQFRAPLFTDVSEEEVEPYYRLDHEKEGYLFFVLRETAGTTP